MLQKIERWSRWTVLAMFLISPMLVYGLTHLPIGSASVHQWLPDGKPEKKRYEQFLKTFGSDQFLIASWDGCRIDDSRLEEFQKKLLDQEGLEQKRIARVTTSRDVVDALTAPPLKLTLPQAMNRLRGFLIGPDDTAAVIIQFTPEGIAQQSESIAQIHAASDAVPNLGRDALRMAGTVYEAYAVDFAAEQSLKKLVLPSCLIGILLAWICLRSVRAALAVLVIAGLGQALAVSAVYFTGGKFSAVLIVLPTLVFMLTLSGAVHLMNYYRDVSAWHKDHLGSRAMLLGFAPSLLSSVTTSLGMASLAISQLAPIKEFGLYSAFSLSVATVFLLLGFPVVSDWFCKKVFVRQSEGGEQIAEAETVKDEVLEHPVHIAPLAKRYVAWMERNAIWVACCGFLLMGFSFYGLLYLRSSTKFDDMFPSNSPTVRDMSFIEGHLGPIASVEVLIRFSADSSLDLLDRAIKVDQVAKQIRTSTHVGSVMSSLTFLPNMPKTSRVRDVVVRSALRAALKNSISKLEEQGWVAESESGQVWRITAKISALTDEDYGSLTKKVGQKVNEALLQMGETEDISVELTGLSPVMHETQQMLLSDLGSSFTTAFLLITPVMMLIARGFWAGLLIMIPNVLPETLVFGTMAWLGFQLDIAGLLTASVAMGIAVNDTLHFVNWYARRLSMGNSRSLAIADTMTSCAVAMIHTMLISCCSMLPFMFADFIPTRQFACLMIAMIGSSILGDLVLLPALLLSPLGLCLLPRKTP